MSDYPSREGRFVSACVELMECGFALPWADQGFDAGIIRRSPAIAELRLKARIEEQLCTLIGAHFKDLRSQLDTETVARKRKVKYHCESCKTNAWGKSGLDIRCVPCGINFTPVVASNHPGPDIST